MSSLNKVFLIGNLGQDPEVRFTPSGQAVCDLRVATTERFTDKAGGHKESTEWHTVIVWGKAAENCGKYLHKGSSVFVEGRLRTREFEKDGQKRQKTEVVAVPGGVIFLSKKEADRKDDGPQDDFGEPTPF